MARSGLPYETATSGERAIREMQKVLDHFGCQQFGHMVDNENKRLIVQFRHRGINVVIEASTSGYAAQWLKHHPYTGRARRTKVDHEREAHRVAGLATYSILRDWLKGQVMAIEAGILSFEGAFLGQMLLPSGKTVLQHATEAKLLLPQGST